VLKMQSISAEMTSKERRGNKGGSFKTRIVNKFIKNGNLLGEQENHRKTSKAITGVLSATKKKALPNTVAREEKTTPAHLCPVADIGTTSDRFTLAGKTKLGRVTSRKRLGTLKTIRGSARSA